LIFYEIFIDLEVDSNKITGWMDFYGESKRDDYKQTLIEIKELIDNKAQVRVKGDSIYFCKSNKEEQWF